jgi:bacteriorhodopsin
MMTRGTYLVLSASAFIGAAGFHVASYAHEVPRSFLSVAWITAAILCAPLVLLFVRLRKETKTEQIWQRFWNTVIERCPRWIWGSMSVAWLLAMFAFVRGIFGHEPAPMVFQSAMVLIPISAALSYSVTLARR